GGPAGDCGTRPVIEKLSSGHALQAGVRYDGRGGGVDPGRAEHAGNRHCAGDSGDLVFLGDWRRPLVPGVTIPVSLIGTFAFVKLLGFSINTLTLFGITLATGLVVDDAIVVIENIERHI